MYIYYYDKETKVYGGGFTISDYEQRKNEILEMHPNAVFVEKKPPFKVGVTFKWNDETENWDEIPDVIFEINAKKQEIVEIETQLTQENYRTINCAEAIVEAFLQLPDEKVIAVFGKTIDEILPYPKEELLPSFTKRKENRLLIDEGRDSVVNLEARIELEKWGGNETIN